MADTKEQDPHVEDDVDSETLFNQITDGDSKSDPFGNLASAEQADEDLSEGKEDTSDQADDENATKPDQDGQEADKETETQASTDDSQDDVFAGLSDAQLERIQSMQHENTKMHGNVRANANRVSALTKKLNEISAAQNDEAEQKSVPDKELDGKSFQEVEEEWPEVADYVRAQVQQAVKLTQEATRKELDPMRQEFEQMNHDRTTQTTQSELDRLSTLHPDYTSINQSTAFNDWVANKPPSIQGLRGSMSADDNIELLNLYKYERQPAAPAPKAARKSDLSEHAELPRKGAAKPQALPDDPSDLFDLITSNKTYK